MPSRSAACRAESRMLSIQVDYKIKIDDCGIWCINLFSLSGGIHERNSTTRTNRGWDRQWRWTAATSDAAAHDRLTDGGHPRGLQGGRLLRLRSGFGRDR